MSCYRDPACQPGPGAAHLKASRHLTPISAVTAHLAYWLPTLSQAARTGMEPRVLMLGDIGQWVAGTGHTRPVSPHILITDTGAGVINQDCSSLLYDYLSYILQHKTFCNSNNFRFIWHFKIDFFSSKLPSGIELLQYLVPHPKVLKSLGSLSLDNRRAPCPISVPFSPVPFRPWPYTVHIQSRN